MKTIFIFLLATGLIHADCIAQQSRPYSVVINEIFADPSPQVSLPEKEWIELYNTSTEDILLQNWRIGYAAGLSGPMPSYILKPDSFVIVCTASSVPSLNSFGNIISVTSFPSLGNEEETLWLRAPDGNVVHAVHYTNNWYHNELKKAGGWTLEMIDVRNPCGSMENWTASIDPSGGTPGRINSVAVLNPDSKAPKLISAFALTPTSVTLFFNEPVDSLNAINPDFYTLSEGIGKPIAAKPVGPIYDQVILTLATPLIENKIYLATATSLTDCSGNIISAGSNSARVGTISRANRFDAIVNEILFNPTPSSVDYVELYNRGNKILDLHDLYLANRNSINDINSLTRISNNHRSFFPGDFIVATSDIGAVKNAYVSENPEAFIEVAIPSYNNDKGNVILLNVQGIVLDEIAYRDDWHFALISNPEGVALERISYTDTSILPEKQRLNWHSAASSVHYGTPGYKNSQSQNDTVVNGTIIVDPKVVSPDNDGHDDMATINYTFPEPGYVANITIFDASGRPIRYLLKNGLCGTEGFYRWDGLNEKKQRPGPGIYIIFTEVFNLKGKVKRFKNVIVVA